MKKVVIVMAILAASCSAKKQRGQMEKCKVIEVTSHPSYGGTIPEDRYVIKTSCGYTMTTHVKPNVGDSIDVVVIDTRKN